MGPMRTPPVPDPPGPVSAGARVVTRLAGAVVAGAATVLALAWFVVPVAGLGGAGTSTTLARATQGSFEDTGVALHCALVLVVGLAGALRPAVGPALVAMAALPLPWLLRFNVLALDAERPAVLVLLTASATVLAVAVAIAVVAAVGALVRRGSRPTPSQIATWAVGVLSLVGTAGLGWYRLRPVAVVGLAGIDDDSDPIGGVLGIGTWSARGSSLGLVLAGLAVGLAALSTGPVRRAGGWVLVAVSATEAVRRGVLPAEDLSPFPVPDVVTVEVLPLGLLVPLVGAGVGAWLALGPEDDDVDGRALEAAEAEPPVSSAAPSALPVTGPPTAWPEPPAS